MKKFITFISIIVAILLINALPSKAMYADISNIVTSLGETMDQVGINYHTRIEGSYILYGTDAKLNGAKKAMPEVHEWERAQQGDYPAFEKRYVCSVNLTGLKLYTTYYYQVVAGATKSDIYTFNTGKNETTTQFAWITDSQTYDNGYNQVDAVIQNLRKNVPNLSFILSTGDITDRGGKEVQWNGLFQGVSSLKDLPVSMLPGNHEYYTTAASGYDSPEIYNQYFNNPKNSFEGRMNSSYYFKYNNILFIMIDAIKNEYVNEQRAWLIDVLENNTADFIIVGTHAGLISAGNYDSDAKRMRSAFQDIFENYAVDLALSGHEHVFAVQKTRYQGEVNEATGVTYVIGPAVGNKTYKGNDDGMDYVQNLNYGGCVITVSSSKLTLAMYNNMGDKQYEFTLKNRRTVSSTYNEEKFLNSMEIVRDADRETARLEWKYNIFGYVEDITVTGKEVNEFRESNIKPITRKIKLANINDLELGTSYFDTNYYYEVVVTMKDGRTVTKTFETINNPELLIEKYNVTFKDKDGNILKEEIVKEGEGATAPTAPTIEGYKFVGWDQEFDEVTGDLVVTAVYEEIKVEEPVDPVPPVEEPTDPVQPSTPSEPEKKGCKKDLVYLTTAFISLVSLGFLVLRKKDN